MKLAPVLLAGCFAALAIANSPDPLAPRPNGMRSATPTRHILHGGTLHISPTETINAENQPVIFIENGQITSVIENTQFSEIITDGYQVHTLDPETHIYAGFIDPYIEVDPPEIPDNAVGTHWNALVTPQQDALNIGLPADAAKNLRKMGFTAAMIAPADGIFRGWSAIVSAAEEFPDPSMGTPPTYKAHAGQMMGFDRGAWPDRAYPNSHMGVVALMRQTFIDAQHRALTDHTDTSCLDQINPKHTTLFYETNQELEALLADNIAGEFDQKNLVIIDNGTAHRRLAAFKELGYPVIVPLTFPKTPEVFSVGAADTVDLATLQHHERAPANARWLLNSGLTVALTTSKLRDGEKFWDNLHTAIEKGLPESDALAMLTTNPAKIIGLHHQGTVAKNQIANLVIASGNLFDPDAKAQIIDLFIDGRPHHINDPTNTRFDGSWTIDLVGIPFQLTMDIDGKKITISTGSGDDDENATENKARKVNIDHNQISFITDDPNNDTTVITGTLSPDGIIRGSGLNPAQQPFQWTATKNPPTEDEADDTDTEEVAEDDSDSDADLLPDLPDSPFGPFAYDSTPEQRTVLLTNATVWTQSDAGILNDAWVLINDGKIAKIGSGPAPRVAADQYIDAKGMHITPGLIDAHSHTGLFRFGVNESGQAVTAEVRIADALDPGYPGFYRELAGGLTTANLLHGSANPIGGQSQTIKLRWNAAKPSDMFFAGAKPGIKFALGENVKQSNWGDRNTTRYPQTRMGVETLIRDRFTKAREYIKAKAQFKVESRDLVMQMKQVMKDSQVSENRVEGDAPNNAIERIYKHQQQFLIDHPRDLELETLAEILAGDRLVHSHSYRQDEILMLCRIAEEFDFKIGTFQHGLETYKVAEIVKEHAIGASIFSDWWAYKVEVQDAIPFAGPINHEVGLLTSYNSDSDDVARRMHVEAGKALKYAKLSGIEMSEQDALNFVTLNPAIQLGIDDRVGSLEVGKDADLVVWTGHPLSSLSRPEMTFIDGRLMFSRELDQHHREKNAAERQRLIQSILSDGKPDKKEETKEDEPTKPTDPNADTCNQLFPAWNTDY
jgi:imidazolonepropionase-like amidohydrolase